MSLDNFMQASLPYLVLIHHNDQVETFNRSYVPLSYHSRNLGADMFSHQPHLLKFHDLDHSTLKQISYDGRVLGDNQTRSVWLYNDDCKPTRSKSFWSAYSERLRVLGSALRKP